MFRPLRDVALASLLALPLTLALGACDPATEPEADAGSDAGQDAGQDAGPTGPGCAPSAEPTFEVDAELVSFTGAGGVELFGTIATPIGEGPFPAVLLFHQFCGSRADWMGGLSTLGADLASRGILVLAFDARGFGESTDGGSLMLCSGTPDFSEFPPMLGDAEAALAFLTAREDVEERCLALGGGSMGSSVAMITAAADPRVHTVVMLSPGLGYLGFETTPAIPSLEPRPWLMMAAEEDTESAGDLRTLEASATTATTLVVPGPAHGAQILGSHEEARSMVIDWYVEHLSIE